jgi:hypothetical protein
MMSASKLFQVPILVLRGTLITSWSKSDRAFCAIANAMSIRYVRLRIAIGGWETSRGENETEEWREEARKKLRMDS